jgi:starch-binding outer membrane protein, SusD/RagB family
MKATKSCILLIVFFTLISLSCKDQLDVKNPNNPTTEALDNEKGILKFALGGIYINGFVDLKYSDGVLGSFWGNGIFDLMADNIGAEAANVFMNQIGCPESVKLDDNSIISNPNSPVHQPDMLRQNNQNGNQGNNPIFYEWAYMYALNRSCNLILSKAATTAFSGDAETRRNTLMAWAYWWKGFAYSRIGSIYYAGVIVDDPYVTNGNFKTNIEILNEAENNFTQAETILSAITANADYEFVLGKIIPDFCQVGKGGILSPAMWIRNINTMRARNIAMNKRVSDMSSSDWNQVLSLTNSGIQESDLVFTGRSNINGDFLSSQGTLSAKATGDPSSATYKISERLVQAFQADDLRKENNFELLPSAWIGNTDRGNVFNTRWKLLDGGNGIAGTIVYSNQTPGENELFMAGSFEENQLLKAESSIMLGGGGIETGLAIVDDVRDYQGAGLFTLAGTGLTHSQAIEQLRSERRVALLFRSLAFYDARRYGIIDPVSSGGGKTGAVVISKVGSNPSVLNSNATIDYQYLDYWDVPDNELAYNSPVAGSATVVNPNE